VQPWIPVIVTIALGVVGLGIQGALLAFFIGRMKENQLGQAALVAAFQTFTAQTIAGLMDRMKIVDEVGAATIADRASINARLMGLERATEGMPQLREDFAAHRATSEAHQARVEAEIGRILQAQEGVQRQLQTLALRQPGKVLELPATGADRV